MYNALLDAFCNELVHMALVISFVVDKFPSFHSVKSWTRIKLKTSKNHTKNSNKWNTDQIIIGQK